MEKQNIELLAKHIVDAGYRVHKELGPGLLETVYSICFMEEMRRRKISAKQEVLLPIYYKGMRLEKSFKIDILIEQEIIIEMKAVETLLAIHTAQIISYLKLADKRLGFLLNFNVPVFAEGIFRYVNHY